MDREKLLVRSQLEFAVSTHVGGASGAAEARDGRTCQTDQVEAGTRNGESCRRPFITGKTAGHG